MSAAHVEGFLEKKSGGKSASPSRFKKAFLEKWDKRFFVLSAGGTELRYYHTAEEAHYQAQKPLGAVECIGAKVFLKAEQGELYRFTVLSAERELNRYGGESHTLLLGIYQMEDAAAFYKMIADPAALARSLSANKGNEGFVQFTRYVVDPGQHSILILDRAQKAKFIGLVAGYYQMSGPTAARLFEIPLTVASDGLLSKTWKATPAQLAARVKFGPDGILNAERLNYDPSEKKMQQAVPLDGGGKEIKLTADTIQEAVQAGQALKKIGD